MRGTRGILVLLMGAGMFSANPLWSEPAPPEFAPASLPPVPDFYREIDGKDVKRFWLSQVPDIHPPARSSPGYAFDMPHYRRRLEARNRLVDEINRGLVDEKAECEALRHNLRHFRNRGREDKVREIEREMLRREAVRKGDLAGLLFLEKMEERSASDVDRRLEEQEGLIRSLKAEIEALRRQLSSSSP